MCSGTETFQSHHCKLRELTVAARDRELTVAARDLKLTVAARDREPTVAARDRDLDATSRCIGKTILSEKKWLTILIY